MQHERGELNDIERKINEDQNFTEAERETLREMMRLYRGWQFVAKCIKGLIVALGLAAAAAASVKTILGVFI